MIFACRLIAADAKAYSSVLDEENTQRIKDTVLPAKSRKWPVAFNNPQGLDRILDRIVPRAQELRQLLEAGKLDLYAKRQGA